MHVIHQESNAMKKLKALLHFAWLGIGVSLASIAQGQNMPLPDKVVLKLSAALPSGISEREIKGAIVEETATDLKLEVSTFRGISNVLTLPLSGIESVERGDHEDRDYLILISYLKLPEISPADDYYEKKLMPVLEGYLKKHPAGKNTAEITSIHQQVEAEVQRMQKGQARLGLYWMKWVDLPPPYRNDWALWQELSKQGLLMNITDFRAFNVKVQEAQNRVLYPFLIEKMKQVSTQRIQTLVDALSNRSMATKDEAIIEENKIYEKLKVIQTTYQKQAVDLLAKIEETSLNSTFDEAVLRTLISENRNLWPKLEILDLILQQAFKHHVARADAFLEEKKFLESAEALVKSGEILPLIKDPSAKKEFDNAALRQKVNKMLDESRLLLSQGKETQALTTLNSLRKLLPENSPMATLVTELSEQAASQINDKSITECTNLRLAGEFERALDRIRQAQIQFMDFGNVKVEQLDRLALEAVALAQEALRKYDFLVAIKASYTGWSISPTNSKARISCLVVVATLLISGLVIVLILLVIFAYLSNLLHQKKFDSRLKSLREDQKSTRMANSRRRKK
jgi:hypothetical protein